MPPTVAQLVDSAAHAGELAGADLVGEAVGGTRLMVRIGLWLADGRVVRARFLATTCASLIAFSEAACRLLEEGIAPPAIDEPLLRRSVLGTHPSHLDRAAIVVAALARTASGPSCGGTP